MATGRVYQSRLSGVRARLALAAGAVASYFNESDPLVRLPARSTHDPATALPEVSGPEYETLPLHESIPAVASEPENVTATAWLYQPPLSVPRSAAGVRLGGVA